MSSGPPLSYYASCVPIALSALTGYSLDMVARTLWAGGAARRMGVGAGVQMGTDTRDAIDLMAFRFGVRAALAVPAGRFSVKQTRDYLTEHCHQGVVEVRRHRVDPEGASEDAPPASPVSVSDWPHDGLWMLEIDVDGTGHALAVIDRKIIAGGEQYAERRVCVGWQILNEEEEACSRP